MNNDKSDSISKEEWMSRLTQFDFKQSDMNKLIMNYLVTEGFKEAAEKFRLEAGLEPTIELSSLDERIMIREAVQNGRVPEAVCLVNKFYPELLDNDRYLFFLLQQLQLIELIRLGKVEDALTFAQTKLSEAGENIPEALNELERTLALLAFEHPENSPFADLLAQSHRQKISSELNAAILKTIKFQEDASPKLTYLLKLLLWAQSKLDSREISYPKMTDLATATIETRNENLYTN